MDRAVISDEQVEFANEVLRYLGIAHGEPNIVADFIREEMGGPLAGYAGWV